MLGALTQETEILDRKRVSVLGIASGNGSK